MLSLFPSLLFLSPFAGMFIRFALAALFALSGVRRIRNGKKLLRLFGASDIVISCALAFGVATQLAALAALACLTYWLFKKDVSPFPRSTVALALIMTFSLLILGPGPFAFDLPL